MSVVNSGIGRVSLFLQNPMIAKLNKVDEQGEPSCTVVGIVIKTLFFLLLTAVGIGVFFFTKNLVPTNEIVEVEGFQINVIEAAISLGGVFIGLIGTFICFKFVRLSIFFGSLYSLAQGYTVAWAFSLFGQEFIFPAILAISLTLLIVLAMLILYQLHIVKVDHKIVSVITTLFFVGVLGTGSVFLMNLFPVTQGFARFIIDNEVTVIGGGITAIIIASLLLLVDFAVIDHSIEAHLPKKYEWLAAYALSFSIIELYLKLINFILRATSKNKESAA